MITNVSLKKNIDCRYKGGSLHQKISLFLSLLLFFTSYFSMVYSQSKIPEGLNYQAIARDDNGNPIANKQIVVEVNIMSENNNSIPAWQEIHRITTTETGFFSLVIGNGTPSYQCTYSNFNEIDWGAGNYSLKVRIDFGNKEFGNGLIDMGTAGLQSVPYAFISRRSFVADSAVNAGNKSLSEILNVDETSINNGQIINWNGTEWTVGDPIARTPTLSELIGTDEATLNTNDVIRWDGSHWDAGNLPNYLTNDGNTDLSDNWTISSANITLQSGYLQAGTLKSNKLQLSNTQPIVSISTDWNLSGGSASDFVLSTQAAIKNYIDNKTSYSAWITDGTNIYNTDDNIGIGTNNPQDKFHADVGHAGFLVTGNYDNGITPVATSGAGSRMAFYPGKAAFRAGGLESQPAYWDNNYIGLYSAAFGCDNRANGKYAIAMGSNNLSMNSNTFSCGKNNQAAGAGSFVAGHYNQANGAYSIATGYNNIADGEYSLVLGEESGANGYATIAGGLQSVASGRYSFAFGNNAKTSTNAEASFAFGKNTHTQGRYSAAFGNETQALTFTETAFGQYNTLYAINSPFNWDVNDRLFVIGNGTGATAALRSDALVVWKDGNVEIPGHVTCISLTETSDKRFKQNILPLSPVLTSVLRINGISYFWRDEEFPQKQFPAEKQIGFIAQDVENIFPELVHTNRFGEKSVDYAKFTVVLLEAIKEQQYRIEKLEAENQKLQQQSKEIEKLKKQMQKMNSTLQNLISEETKRSETNNSISKK